MTFYPNGGRYNTLFKLDKAILIDAYLWLKIVDPGLHCKVRPKSDLPALLAQRQGLE